MYFPKPKRKNAFRLNKKHDNAVSRLDQELIRRSAKGRAGPPRVGTGREREKRAFWLLSDDISNALARNLFVFLNGHYLVVIRYCQSVWGENTRALKENLETRAYS